MTLLMQLKTASNNAKSEYKSQHLFFYFNILRPGTITQSHIPFFQNLNTWFLNRFSICSFTVSQVQPALCFVKARHAKTLLLSRQHWMKIRGSYTVIFLPLPSHRATAHNFKSDPRYSLIFLTASEFVRTISLPIEVCTHLWVL
jgi:hypothetical protein